MNSVARSALARTMSFVPTAIATLLTSKLILRQYGVESFDAFSLLVTLMNLVPFNNLGVGAAVTHAYADETSTAEHAHRVTLTAARALTISTLATSTVALTLSATHTWHKLLGGASGPDWYVGWAIVLFALSFAPGLGQSVLLGVHRNHTVVWVQTFIAPLILVATVGLIAVDGSGPVTLLFPPAAILATTLVTCWQASRATNVSWGRIASELVDRENYPGASIRALSGPLFIITITGPLALQSDRIVLSHVSTASAVANYSVVLQIFAPVLALIAATAQPLWPIWTQARSRGKRGPRVGRVVLVFSLASTAICAVLVLVSNTIGEIIGASKINLGVALPLACAATVVAIGVGYPVGMALRDPKGIRFVAGCALIGVPTNVALSVVLAKHLGAPGPFVATLLVGVAIQLLPPLIYAMRREATGDFITAAAEMSAVPDQVPNLSSYDYELFTVPMLDRLPTTYEELLRPQ